VFFALILSVPVQPVELGLQTANLLAQVLVESGGRVDLIASLLDRSAQPVNLSLPWGPVLGGLVLRLRVLPERGVTFGRPGDEFAPGLAESGLGQDSGLMMRLGHSDSLASRIAGRPLNGRPRS
jgi:hypothetical protein